MESHLLQYVVASDKESSICGGESPPPPPVAPSSMLQCWDCFSRFSSEAALIQHLAQTKLQCTFAAKALFLERLKHAAAAAAATIVPKMPYHCHHQFEEPSSSQSPLLDTEEGSATNDPFGDGNMTLDLVSPMDHHYYYDFVASNAHHHQELDLELKL